MQTCERCRQDFPTWVRIRGKVRNLCSRKYCLKCSPWGQHNTTKLKDGNPVGKCGTCKKSLAPRPRLGGARPQHSTVLCMYCYLKKRRAALKKKAVAFKGGRCLCCGYRRSVVCLCFHHLDPKKKDFSISRNKNWGWPRIEKELRKCVLLCMNCHGEVHAGLVSSQELKAKERARLAQPVEPIRTRRMRVAGSSPAAGA